MRFDAYQTQGFRDEMFDDAGVVRPEARLLLQLGITFNVYGDSAGAERIFPFDLIPRIVRAEEWAWIERGLKQRIHALNEFIDDIYHDQKILKDKIIPEEVIYSATFYCPQCAGINPPGGLVSHYWHGSGAARRWQHLCAGGQLASAFWRFVCAREPGPDEADFSAGV